MADVENQQDSSFPVKRKSDLYCQDQDNAPSKAQKLNPSENSAVSESKDGEINGSELTNLNSSTEEKIVTESSVLPEKSAASESEKDENGVSADLGTEEEQEGGEVEEYEEEDEEEEEDYSVEDKTDMKGKGISREDKGKGKLIEEDESDDDDDSDEEDGEEEDESDLSDDPLAEVDLDNILPSRTRRRSIQPGVYISNQSSDRGLNNEDDDSSDDSDA